MTIKELCKKQSSCDACPYLPICRGIPEKYELGDDLEVTNAIVETAKALEPIDYKTLYENYLKKSEVVISQLRADRDRLLKALNEIRAEIEKLQTYKMFLYEKTVYVERDDVLAIIDKYKEESEGKE